jgi:Carboxypeptidase regulatory-like domain
MVLSFYPQAESLDRASTIEVIAGQESPFDFRVQRHTQTYRRKGRLIDATGNGLRANINIDLGYRSFLGVGGFSPSRSFDRATGAFELQGIPPGDYTLRAVASEILPLDLAPRPLDPASSLAQRAATASLPSAQLPIRVVDKDIEDVVLTLIAPPSTTGRFMVEGQAASVLPNLQQIGLTFSLDDSQPEGEVPVALPVGLDGVFQIVGLREGEYRVSFRGQNPAIAGFYVKSVRYDNNDILAKTLKIAGSSPGTFEVVFRAGASPVSGIVTDSKSQAVPGIQVVAVPEQKARWIDYRVATTDQNGLYSLIGLTPGAYRIYSWEAADNNAFYDPDFLKEYEAQRQTRPR